MGEEGRWRVGGGVRTHAGARGGGKKLKKEQQKTAKKYINTRKNKNKTKKKKEKEKLTKLHCFFMIFSNAFTFQLNT